MLIQDSSDINDYLQVCDIIDHQHIRVRECATRLSLG